MQAPPPMPAHLQGSLPQAPPAFMHHQPPPPLNHGLAPHPGQAPPQAQPQQAIGPRPGFFNPISSPFMFGPAPPPPSGLGMPPHHQHPLNHSSLNEHQNTTYYFPSANTASSSSSSSSNAQSSNNNNGGNSNKSKSSIGKFVALECDSRVLHQALREGIIRRVLKRRRDACRRNSVDKAGQVLGNLRSRRPNHRVSRGH